MKDFEGNELNVGDEVIHAVTYSSSICLRRKTIVALKDESQAQVEWDAGLGTWVVHLSLQDGSFAWNPDLPWDRSTELGVVNFPGRDCPAKIGLWTRID